MKQQIRKFSNLWWITVTVAVLMALLFAVETPLVAFAESESKGKYIKETVMITATGIEDANAKVKKLNDSSEKTYYLFGTPIYSHDGLETYIAYTTTNNVKNSVKAIKSMYMKGGWSYEEYDKYLDQLKEETNYLAKDLYKAICEYATHLKAGKKNALYVKKILNYLYEDDSNLKLSDFFVWLAKKGGYNYDFKFTDEQYALVKDEMITFLMQANKDILTTVECALMVACKDSYEGFDAYLGEEATDTSFLTGMQRTQFLDGVKGYKDNPKYAYLDVYVQDLLVSLPQVQEDIRFYMDSPVKLEGEVEEMSLALQDEIIGCEPTDSNQYFELEEELIESIKSEGSEKEKQTAEELESFDAYLENLSSEDQTRFNNGKMFYDALSACEYTGYDNQYDSLLDLFMAHEGTTEEISTQYSNDDFYPFLIQLSEGQRALLKVSFSQFLSIHLMPTEMMDAVYKDMYDIFNEAAETEEEKIKEGEMVSVYNGVDRSLYIKDSGIALTSKAIVAAQSKPLEHIVTSGDKVTKICNIIAIASGGTAAASIITFLGMSRHLQSVVNSAIKAIPKAQQYFLRQVGNGWVTGMLNDFTFMGRQGVASIAKQIPKKVITKASRFVYGQQADVVLAFSEDLTVIASENVTNYSVSFTKSMASFLKMGFGIALEWIMAVSIGVMIISLIVELIYPLIKPEDDAPYIDIPRVMCSYEEVYGQTKIEGMDPVEDYIYYYGMKNPFLTDEDNVRANTRRGGDGKDTTDITKYGIGDVANWTLKGMSRQWVAIYASTDSKAGKPILADSLTVLNDINGFNKDKELIPVIKFHENAPFDFNDAYAATKNKDLTPVYLGYKFDNNAGTTTTQTASVFSSITLWGGIAAGLILGGGIGTLVTYGIIRKRKKSSVTA